MKNTKILKAISLITILLACSLIIISCKKKTPKITVDKSNITMYVGDTAEFNYQVIDSKNPVIQFELSALGIVELDDNKIIAIKEGSVDIKLYLVDNNEAYAIIKVVIEETPKIKLNGKATQYLNEEQTLTYDFTNLEGTPIFESLNEDVATVDQTGKVTPLKVGTVTIKATIGNYSVVFTITIEETPKIKLNGKATQYLNEEQTLTYDLTNLEGTPIFESLNEDVATVDQTGKVTPLKVGTVTIKATIGNYSDEFTITIEETPIIKLNGKATQYLNEEQTLTYDFTNLEGTPIFESLNEDVATVDQTGKVTPLKVGTVTIKATIGNYSDEFTIEIKEKDLIKPIITFTNISDNDKLNWNQAFNPLTGVSAEDNIDGDLTSQIKVIGSINNQEYGKQTITYQVTDSSGNIAIKERTIDVIWNYDVKFIGHAGSYYGIMNSEEAILYAATVLKYQAIEVDLKQSSDGVFILCHDDTFGGKTLASTPWSTLKDIEETKSRTGGIPGQNGSVTKSSYTSKLCTLERYLEICKQYNIIPVIELKSSNGITNSNQSRMQALMNVIEKHGMLDKVILLGSQYNCLIWTRNNGYEDVACQYLVNSCESETILQRCIDYNFDISINVTSTHSNSLEWIAKYKEVGCKVSTYTFTQWVDYPKVQEWINNGVDFVTCDWQLMSKLTLPVSTNSTPEKHKVTFKDADGTILKESQVADGRTAAAPSNPSLKGYEFIGWDKELTKIKEDTVFTAQYKIITYQITYTSNNLKITETSWSSKDEFVNEFYNDLYTWFTTNGKNLSFVTENNGNFTFVKNGVTVTFASANDIIGIDISSFEKTISNIIYKPTERLSDDSSIIVADENYFLNSEAYRIKYQGVDGWLINCIRKTSNYNAYDDTYTPTSSGKIQIFYRMHQWVKGTNIPAFNTLPKKYLSEKDTSNNEVLPISPINYTIEDEIILPSATGNKQFLGWYLDKDLTIKIEKIEKGTTGNLVLYAKWAE